MTSASTTREAHSTLALLLDELSGHPQHDVGTPIWRDAPNGNRRLQRVELSDRSFNILHELAGTWPTAKPYRYPAYGTLWVRARLWILRRDGHRCRLCGDLAEHVDHIWPQARGGSDAPENLQAACVPCNSHKSADLPSGMLPLFRCRSRDEEALAQAEKAELRGHTWAAFADRMIYEPHEPEKCTAEHTKRFLGALEWCGYWLTSATSISNRVAAQARCLDWALALPPPSRKDLQ